MTQHQYEEDDRCICGGQVVYHEDTIPPGNGCEAEGKPWAWDVRLKDPQERRDDARYGIMERYQFMTPKGMTGSIIYARNEDSAVRQAESPPHSEEVLDLMTSLDEFGKPIILLVVADD